MYINVMALSQRIPFVHANRGCWTTLSGGGIDAR